MSFEPGGRSDKYGNKYENSYLAKLFLRLTREEAEYIKVEPIGENSDSFEYISKRNDGVIEYYQCKASDQGSDYWRCCDLKKFEVFKRSQEIIESGSGDTYVFISPISYKELNELCKRARTNASPEDFLQYQINNDNLRKWLRDWSDELKLSLNKPDELRRLVYILAHCRFEQFPFGEEQKRDFEAEIGRTFTGDTGNIRVLLEQFANDNGLYGIEITAKMVIDYMAKKDHLMRSYQRDETILQRIDTLNSAYWGTYPAIHNQLFKRPETQIVIQNVEAGKSVIIHGKAGYGKSGCLEELIQYLQEHEILYLAIKLDKNLPRKTADQYGKDLGFRESPIHCLATMAADRPCILIMDQLDALQWNGNDSANAIQVLKEMITQANTLNRQEQKNISIIFASRTFDLDNNPRLRDLLSDRQVGDDLIWEKVQVGLFTREDVIQIIGEQYNALSPRLQNLLLTPSSLYVWTKLDEEKPRNDISTFEELMKRWWEQIQNQCEKQDMTPQETTACRNKIVAHMEKRGKFFVPAALLRDEKKIIDAFESCGLIKRVEGSKIAFLHQSFLDYFIVMDMINGVYDGKKLADLLGERDQQTPIIRYRLLTALQILLDGDEDEFIEQGKFILENDGVRFYFKCAVFEVLGQCITPSAQVLSFLSDYDKKPEWGNVIYQSVLYGHASFIQYFDQVYTPNWMEKKNYELLWSIRESAPEFVVEKITPYALNDERQDSVIFHILGKCVVNGSENAFKLMKQILDLKPEFLMHTGVILDLLEGQSDRAIDLFRFIIEHPEEKFDNIYFDEPQIWKEYVKCKYKNIINGLFRSVCEETKEFDIEKGCRTIWYEYSEWIKMLYNDSARRKIVEILKLAFKEYAEQEPNTFIDFISGLYDVRAAVGHEMIIHGLSCLPTGYSDFVIRWLLEKFETRVFVYTADEGDHLCYAKKIISKFSPFISDELFERLENAIYYWNDPLEDRIKWQKRKLEIRREYGDIMYTWWSGMFQKILLPCLATGRISKYSRQLLRVLERNTQIDTEAHYKYPGLMVDEDIHSAIKENAERFSDKTWLEIIAIPSEKLENRRKNEFHKNRRIKSTHGSFSSTMASQAEISPLRFVKLALQFPEKCYPGYITGTLDAYSKHNIETEEEQCLLKMLISHYIHHQSNSVLKSALRLIGKNSCVAWSEDTLKAVEWNALHGEDEYDNEENISLMEIETRMINCVRGVALETISCLLWNNKEYGERFQNIICQAALSEKDHIRFAALNCVHAYYNIDSEFATQKFIELLEKDLRSLVPLNSWKIVCLQKEKYGEYFEKMLEQACVSDEEELSKAAAGYLCASVIYYKNEAAKRFLFAYQFNEEEESCICEQACSSFNNPLHYNESCNIILHFAHRSDHRLSGIGNLFLKKKIQIERDQEFLIELTGTKQGGYLIYPFIRYLKETEEGIGGFAPVLLSIANSAVEHSKDEEILFEIRIEDFLKCVNRLFDENQNKPEVIKICLDIWDRMFSAGSNIRQPMTDLIDRYS